MIMVNIIIKLVVVSSASSRMVFTEPQLLFVFDSAVTIKAFQLR